MEGMENEWTAVKKFRKIYYTKLPPGNYTFKVKGASGGEVWNEKERELHITILPPIWASTAAYLLYAIILLCIIIIIFRYYSMALTEKNMRKIKTLEIEKEREIYNAKIEFFTNITHEIRTPLTLIKLPLEKLMHTLRDNTDINESLKMMKRNTNRLIDLTNQLLDFRKAEADNFSLSFLRTDVNELLKETAAPFKKAAEEKGLTFKLEMPRLSLHAYIDAEAFRKIMNNLFSNAIKYANSSIFIGLLPFGSTDQAFKIEVKSDGFLIPYELGEKIFEAFYRMKETEKQAGTGIGLPLARSLAVLHKGTLLLKEPQNGFNIFLLSLPIHQEKEIHFDDDVIIETAIPAVKHAEVIADTGKPFILLVEDSKEILGFIESELRPAYNILKAYNGQEALEALQTENVQLVVSDIMMPVMDGIALCKKLKTDFQYSHIPIILLTAKNTLNSKIEGLEVGADAYIEKPFAFEHLQAQITNLIVNRNIIKDYFARSPLTHLKGIACSRADANFLEQLHDVIYENITDIDLDVDQLSKLMNISRPTLYRKIKALSNLTPNELINLSRLKKAAELLRLGDYKINEVANMVGYSLQSNFSRDFHKQFGITPSSYMSSVQSEKKPG
jgi:signal transduction histidine kinase/DNA-binding response OmpR family regulator